jgi:hypothetical protein
MKISEQLWVGEFDDGEVVVYSAGAQRVDEPEWVYLWSLQTRRTEGYAKDRVRKSIRKTEDAAKAGTALARYMAWVTEQRIAAQEEAAQNHRRRLERLGLAYSGARKSTGKVLRVTHCWDCKKHLDNSIELECNSCGWILCECGACGCGYAP